MIKSIQKTPAWQNHDGSKRSDQAIARLGQAWDAGNVGRVFGGNGGS